VEGPGFSQADQALPPDAPERAQAREDDVRRICGPRGFQLSAITLILLCALPCIAQAGKVEKIGSASDSAISDAVKNTLEATGYRLTTSDGFSCEVWWRKSVPAQAKKDVPGTLYLQFGESALLGIISYPQSAADYRGQPVKPGVYTLRYALLPNDANHLGVAPNRDFVLLVPAAADANPDATPKPDELVELSRKASGTRHPAAMSLTQAQRATPSLSKDGEDHWIFAATVKLSSGDELPVALIVKGTAPQ
jgi:hypothetical protein